MNDTSRNTRTLIVSFVVAIMALIPLRFVEVGQSLLEQPQVLGEGVVLPEDGSENSLEAPYAEIENVQVLGGEVGCIAAEDAQAALSDLGGRVESGELTAEEIIETINQMQAIEENTCK